MASASTFQLTADFTPTGDQPDAIAALNAGLDRGTRYQTLEGVTGSGKTYTVANTIAHWGRPALVISHNKTLAAQLYAELQAFFPHNAVEYFVSYYDYYQPEAYIPQTDTFIDKDSSINEEIERLRLSATNALLSRNDVIIVASVSCIYGLGSPEDYREMAVEVPKGAQIDRNTLLERLVDIQYTRNDVAATPGTFRVRGDTLDVFPSYSKKGVRLNFFGDEVERVRRIDVLTGHTEAELDAAIISPARHFVMPYRKIEAALSTIQKEMEQRVQWFEAHDKLLEAQRISMRSKYDLEMMRELGFCAGIENYSRHLAGRAEGERPATLLDYFDGEFLTIIDESHVTLPQIRGMYNGDRSRKETLVEHGFRLPSAMDNRPLRIEEFQACTGPIIFASATPGPLERELGGEPILQVIRPTGIIEPPVEVRPLENQIDDLIEEVRQCAEKGERVLVTTLTKRTSEDLAEYLQHVGLRVKYLHSEIDAIERVEVLRGLRMGAFDCLVGINLLREGLDLPEVSLVAVLDADKEGFLRSETALVQTAGRAARHIGGRVILYADTITNSMSKMLKVTNARREKQLAYNAAHAITPRSIAKNIQAGLALENTAKEVERSVVRESGVEYDVYQAIEETEREMLEAAKALEFERAAFLRDQLLELKEMTPEASGEGPRQKKAKKTRYPTRAKGGHKGKRR